MDTLLFNALESRLPLVALLWLASVLFAVTCARRYLASRAADRSLADSVTYEPFIRVDSSSTGSFVGASAADDGVSASDVATQDQTPPMTPIGDDMLGFGVDDQQPGTAPRTTSDVNVESHAEAVREALRARVKDDGASAGPLRDVVRALYLDESNFRFHAIADLPPGDRELARALIDEWLANPGAIDYWQDLYAIFREVPDEAAARQQA